MADVAVTYGASAIFGAVTGWKYVGGSSDQTHGIAEAHDELGNVAAHSQTDEMLPKSANLECYDDTNTVPASIGAILNSIDLTGITINLNYKDKATMSLTGHNHTANAHASLNLAAHGMSVTTAFGANDVLGGTAGDVATVESASINITCEHMDEPDEGGVDHFAGQNFNGKVQVTQTWIGVPTTPYDTAIWTGSATQTVGKNDGLTRTVVNVVKYLTLAAPV
jgi:hypothetical protein